MIGLKKFTVIPKVPDNLTGLFDIAYNVWLFWTPDAIKLFIRMDEELWEKAGHNPVAMLGQIDQARLDELAGDDAYAIEVQRVHKNLLDYLAKTNPGGKQGESGCIAYFSLEFGLTEALPIYSGGLGVLAGDHIKSSSDSALALWGVGLLYQFGYFRQYLNQDGWQQDFYRVNDFFNMPLQEVRDKDGHSLEVQLSLPGRELSLKAWWIHVGRVKIYLLDANLDKNREADRRLTAQLYGGDRELRLLQEMILGIGGMRLLDALGLDVDVIHMNEGHSAFALFERARLLMQNRGIDFALAMEVTKKSSVFTTHTPVPAGHDEFSPELMGKYFTDYIKDLQIPMDRFLGFGRAYRTDDHENFSMPVAALRNASFVNGVSKLHAGVARKMWQHLWPHIPTEHVPIHPITNGVHLASWLSFEMMELFRRYLGDRWFDKQDSRSLWEKIHKIPDPELWRVHSVRRRRLIYFIRSRLQKQLEEKGASRLLIEEASEAMNPDALTIGFARRFATYKRGDLVLRDWERLLKILNDESRPVQFIFAGKAHPQDHAGKEIIKRIVGFINIHSLVKKVVFLEDYDMNVARYMVQGVDVWLNNPLRPLEASGTSGMKAAANGVLNFSVMDGWWDEAYDRHNGWAIGNGEEYDDRNHQDEVESKAIYSILEHDVLPLFYEQRTEGVPREWIKMMKNAFISVVSHFNTRRMIGEYNEKFYVPAAKNFNTLTENNFKAAKEFMIWQDKIKKNFQGVRVLKVDFNGARAIKIGETLPFEVEAFLGNLEPNDVRVDIYYGRLAGDGTLQDSTIYRLEEVESLGENLFRFSGQLTCNLTGRFGFKVRITPDHPLLDDPAELNLVTWD